MLSSIVEIKPAPDLESASGLPRLELTNLFNIAEWQHEVPWQPFKEGLEIYRLYGDGQSGPNAALIRFKKGGSVPFHAHTGFEHILILTGSQRDEHGVAAPGTLIINSPGTAHTVVSEVGCIVLAIYEKPVEFLAEPDKAAD
ncbi:MAG TPA: cupin domain-containing protein [Chthoniobacter sp.]|nr:cupin domain-containing protein [Chthoniobacter sp.]